MKSEENIRKLLAKLSEWKKGRDAKEWVEQESFFEDSSLGLYIMEDVEHSGVSEWIDALQWVLGESEKSE